MASKTIYTCDICGREKQPKGNISFEDETSVNGGHIVYHDVCLQCFNRIKGYVNDMRSER